MTTSIRILVLVAAFCIGLQQAADSAHSGTSQMIDLSSSPLASLRRPRREADGENEMFCCNFDLKNGTKEEDEAEDKCDSEVRKKLGIKERGAEAQENTKDTNDGQEYELPENYAVCMEECLFKVFKAADSNGNVIPDEALKQVKLALILEDEKIWNGVQNECGKVKTDSEQNSVCNRQSNQYLDCALDFIEMYCPADKQVKDPTCDDRRVALRKKYNVE
ncbi:uncharacterized protein [Periplaneta americana]|uniref:uncharacterized protein n=1 Tax=Periplaneta americana TaxID=6978 RepID=UPI0037E7A5E6